MHTAEQHLSHLRADSAVFVSDLHLSDETPALILGFERFCETVTTEWLIVMGDLFEGYCGDDDQSACIVAVEHTFLALHRRGVHVALMHGNRDFMIGAAFAQRCHAVILNDPCWFNDSILLSHGDAWCTLDAGYQAWRATCRAPAWQAAFLAQPLATRHAQIQAYRSQSKAAQMDVSTIKTDVVDATVIASAAVHGCHTVLHGHTHRPSDRLLEGGVRKVVLGDWDEQGNAPVVCARYQNNALTTFLA